mgnify:CR=1 FL=1
MWSRVFGKISSKSSSRKSSKYGNKNKKLKDNIFEKPTEIVIRANADPVFAVSTQPKPKVRKSEGIILKYTKILKLPFF